MNPLQFSINYRRITILVVYLINFVACGMKFSCFIYLLYLFNCVSPYVNRNLTCGVDKSNATMVYEGRANIATYPWMGTFYYPLGKKKVTTAVVLITKQIVLGAANDIDMLPKDDLRQRSWVTLGRNCDAPGFRIRDYSFHPDFRHDTYSALALIQLEVDLALQELIPICGPPTYFINPQIYAMTSSNNCKKGIVYIHKMKYVNKAQCQQFYRKSGLDADMFWPSYATCARALSGGQCKWRSGAALVVKQDGRWRLLGFGVNGPGCQAPARFLDYGMHQQWVRNSVARIGMPAITRLDPNHIVMRRSLGNLQRYGPCDQEETKYEMYTDRVKLESTVVYATATYNLTLIHGVEYSCVVLRVDAIEDSSENDPCVDYIKPRLHLRRWCAGPQQMCHGFQFLEIKFFLDIEFSYNAYFHFAAYGKEAIIILPTKSMAYVNSVASYPSISIYGYIQVKLKVEAPIDDHHLWFYKKYKLVKMDPRKEPKFIAYYNNKYNTSIKRSGRMLSVKKNRYKNK